MPGGYKGLDRKNPATTQSQQDNDHAVLGVTESRKLTSLARQNNTLPFIFGAQFGGSPLDSWPCWKGRSCGPGGLCINPSSMAIVSIPELGDLAHNQSCFSHLPFELVQYTPRGAAV